MALNEFGSGVEADAKWMDTQTALGNNIQFIGLEFIEHLDVVPHCLFNDHRV